MKHLLLIAALMLLYLTTLSQPNRYRFHRYGLEEGLSSSSVNAIAEDEYGFIWLGTDDGLFRFDANEFRPFRKSAAHHSQLPSNSITALLPLDNGRMLVGTRSGLVLFESGREKFVSPWKGIPPSDRISAISPHEGSKYWVGTRAGLYLLDISTGEFQHFKNVPDDSTSISSNEIIDLQLDAKERLWISTLDGLNLFQKESKDFLRFLPDNGDPNAISSSELRYLALGPNGELLVGTATGGLNVMLETGVFKRFTHDSANPSSLSSVSAYSLLLDSEDNVWVGTWSNGLNKFDLNTGQALRYANDPNDRYSLPSNSIKCLFESTAGDIWIGTDDGGLARLSPANEQIIRFTKNGSGPSSLKTSHVRSVFEDDEGILWIGTARAGLSRYDSESQNFIHYLESDGSRRGNGRGSIWAISPGADDNLWLGTSIGLGKFDKKTGKTQFYEPDPNNPSSISTNDILSVLYDEKGSVYAGTWNGGLNRLDLSTGKFESFYHDEEDSSSLAGNTVTVIYQDKQGRLWVEAGDIWHLYLPEERSFQRFGIAINQVAEDEEGVFWIASYDGLIRFDAEEKVSQRVELGDGSLDASFTTIELDSDGNIWLGSEKGILCYDKGEQKVVASYDEKRGLAGNNISSYVSHVGGSSGNIYMGGVEGLSQIDPAMARQELDQPEMTITDFLLFNRPVEISDSTAISEAIHTSDAITLNYNDYLFAFEFSALYFQHPQGIQYAYQLDGLDESWIEASYLDRKAVYTNVPPGEYTFRVRSTDTNGNWLDNETVVAVSIVPPWWDTTLAKVFFYLALVSLIASIFRIRLEFIKKQNRVLEKQVEERASEILRQKQELEVQAEQLTKANDQKNKLFSIIAHDLKAPVNTLSSMLPILDPSILKEKDLDMIKEDLSKKLTSVDGAMNNLLLWAKSQLEGEVVKPTKLAIKDILDQKVRLYAPYADSKEISLSNEVSSDLLVLCDENMLRAIFRNLISNAIKFTPVKGQVKFDAKTENEFVVVSITDSGVGIDQEMIPGLFEVKSSASRGTGGEQGVGLGLIVVKEFVEKNGGKIWVESRPNQGTTFYFTVPVQK